MALHHTAVENLKAEAKFFEAGLLAAESKKPRRYGAHYGFRSDRAAAEREFFRGYDSFTATDADAPDEQSEAAPERPLRYSIYYVSAVGVWVHDITHEDATTALNAFDARDRHNEGRSVFLHRDCGCRATIEANLWRLNKVVWSLQKRKPRTDDTSGITS